MNLLHKAPLPLKLIFLNHSGPPSKLLSDISSIDLLADKKSTADFISYCESHPLVNEIRIIPQYRKTEIILEFRDRSELRFCLLRSMIRKALSCLQAEKIRNESFVNEFNMLGSSLITIITNIYYSFASLQECLFLIVIKIIFLLSNFEKQN